MKLLKASRTPNLGACLEDIHFLPDRSLNPDLITRLGACNWIDHCTNLVILGPSSVGKSYLAQALVNAAARHDYTVRYYRLDDLANQLAVRPTKIRPDWSSCKTCTLAMPSSWMIS